MEAEERRASEAHLLRLYYRTLTDAGIDSVAYPFEACLCDVQLGVLCYLRIPLHLLRNVAEGHGAFDPNSAENARAQRLSDAMIARSADMIDDWRCREALDSLLLGAPPASGSSSPCSPRLGLDVAGMRRLLPEHLLRSSK